MSYIGIGSPIPDIASLPGQTGGEVEVTLDYPSAAVCNGDSAFSPSEATPVGGVFAATPSGLNINSSTGQVTPTGSTPQAYTITYTVSGVVSSFSLTINAVEQSTFSYSSSSLEQYGTASPIFASGTTTGGTFSATSGLVINTTTGVLDLANSTIGGPYTVTYTTPGTCSTSSTFNVSITALSTSLVNNNFAMEFNGQSYVDASDKFNFVQTTGVFSTSTWLKINDHTSSVAQAILGTNYTSVNIGFYLWYDNRSTHSQDRVLRFQFANGSTNQLDNPQAITDNNWHLINVVGDGTTIKMYKDGVQLSNTLTISGSTSSEGFANLRIGANTQSPAAVELNGDLDEVAIWSRALELSDVQRIYNATNSNPGKAANLFSTGLSQNLVYWNRMGDN